jgi:hypothetical protein
MTSKTVVPRYPRVYVECRAIASTDSEAHDMTRIPTKPFGIFGNETPINRGFNNEESENLGRSPESFIEKPISPACSPPKRHSNDCRSNTRHLNRLFPGHHEYYERDLGAPYNCGHTSQRLPEGGAQLATSFL